MKIFVGIALSTLALTQVACAAASGKKSDRLIVEEKTKSEATMMPGAGGGFVEDRHTFKVEGMHCEACAKAIKAKLEKVPGVAEATVDFKSGEVKVISAGPSRLEREPLVKAIQSAGKYKVN